MKLSPILAATAAAAALAASASAGTIFSWEGDLQGWSAGLPHSVALSTIGATVGTSSLAITGDAGSMWWNAPAWGGLDGSAITALATAEKITLDVTYFGTPDTWNADLNVGLMLNAQNVAWGQYGASFAVTPNGVTQTVEWTLSETAKSNLVSSGWAQVGLFLTYGNGGSAPSLIYVDNLATVTASSPIPEPSTYAAIGGLLVLGFAVLGRRRRG